MECYVTMLPIHARRDFAKLRTSSHCLEIEVGRYQNPSIPQAERICKLCSSNCVKDEKHFLVECPYYDITRKEIIKKYKDIIPFNFENTLNCFEHLFLCSKGFPPTTKLACSLAMSLFDVRKQYFSFTEPLMSMSTTTVLRSGRISKPPDRFTITRVASGRVQKSRKKRELANTTLQKNIFALISRENLLSTVSVLVVPNL